MGIPSFVVFNVSVHVCFCCLCACVCVHVCMCVCTCVCTFVHVCVYVCVYVCAYLPVHLSVSPWGAWAREIWQIMWYVVSGCDHVHSVSTLCVSTLFCVWVRGILSHLVTDFTCKLTVCVCACVCVCVRQALWVSTVLLQHGPGHLSRDEAEDPDGPVPVSHPRVGRGVRGRWGRKLVRDWLGKSWDKGV